MKSVSRWKQKKLRKNCFIYCCVLCFRAHSRCEAKCDKTKLFAFVVLSDRQKERKKGERGQEERNNEFDDAACSHLLESKRFYQIEFVYMFQLGLLLSFFEFKTSQRRLGRMNILSSTRLMENNVAIQQNIFRVAVRLCYCHEERTYRMSMVLKLSNPIRAEPLLSHKISFLLVCGCLNRSVWQTFAWSGWEADCGFSSP